MIIATEKEKYLETDRSYYYDLIGINYLIERENKIVKTNVNMFSDIEEKQLEK